MYKSRTYKPTYKTKYVGTGVSTGDDYAVGQALAAGARRNDVGYKPSSFNWKILTMNEDLHQYRWLAESLVQPGQSRLIKFHPSMKYDLICGTDWDNHTAYGTPTVALYDHIVTERYLLRQWAMNFVIEAGSFADVFVRICWAVPRYKSNLSSGTPDQFWNHNVFEQQNSAYWKVLSSKMLHVKGRTPPYQQDTLGTGTAVMTTSLNPIGAGVYRLTSLFKVNTMYRTSGKTPPTNAASWDLACNQDVSPVMIIDTSNDNNSTESQIVLRVFNQFDYFHIADS